ncbi:MAG: hypothetical protein KDC38_19085, partial [Planctomycetes bacterium]|nr:hypothetical protein [Planctomycetota bacterium]
GWVTGGGLMGARTWWRVGWSILLIATSTSSTPLERAVSTRDAEEFRRARTELIGDWAASIAGHSYAPTDEERAQDQRLRALVTRLREAHGEVWLSRPAVTGSSFREWAATLRDSELYRFLRPMPKGALLHTHLWGMIEPEFLIEAHRDDPLAVIHTRTDDARTPLHRLGLSARVPDGWRRLGEYLEEFPDRAGEIARALRYDPPPDLDERWSAFERCFGMSRLHLSAAHLEAHLRHIFDRARAHGILAIEAKADWRGLVRGPGDFVSESETCGLIADVVARYRSEHPDFRFGLHASTFRSFDPRQFANRVRSATTLAEQYPEWVVGLDLCGRERGGTPIESDIDGFLALRDGRAPLHLSLHAGETRDGGTLEVADALLVGAERIGHALTLWKQPPLIDIVRERGVTIELCPLSNALLGFVDDLRDHPGWSYLRLGLPVVLSTDDEGVFGTDPTLEFVAVAVAWQLDLWQLKRLAETSIERSFLPAADRRSLIEAWRRRWIEWCRES